MRSFRCLFVCVLSLLLSEKLAAQENCPDTCAYFIPNSLTPDCESFGCEILEIVCNCPFREFDFTLYDRWGEIHFHSTDPEMKFDSANSKQGTYTWVFTGQYCNGSRFSDTGHLTVVW